MNQLRAGSARSPAAKGTGSGGRLYERGVGSSSSSEGLLGAPSPGASSSSIASPSVQKPVTFDCCICLEDFPVGQMRRHRDCQHVNVCAGCSEEYTKCPMCLDEAHSPQARAVWKDKGNWRPVFATPHVAHKGDA